MDKNSLCRLCLLTSEEYYCIFDDETGNTIPEIDFLLELFHLNIYSHPSKSNLMCVKCHLRLEDFRKFHNTCLENEKLWDKFITDDLSDQHESVEYFDEYIEETDIVLPDTEIPKIEIVDAGSPKVNKPTKRSLSSKSRSVDKLEEEDRKIRKFFDLSCHKCKPSFRTNTFNEYKSHLRTVHDEHNPGLMCCGKKLSKRMDVIDHINWHVNPEKLRCKYCKRVYSDTKNLRTHILQFHGSDEDRPYECEPCGKRFAKLDPLRLHMRTHLSEETRESMRKYVCDLCDQNFLSNAILKAHIKYTHLRQGYVCDSCAKHFKSKFDYEIHRRNVHGEEGPARVQCSLCDKWYSNSKALKGHIKSIHNRTESISCHICGMETTSKQSLYGHIRMKHTERAFKCDYCEKSFATPSRLKEHRAIHTGIALYSCPYCADKHFNVRANMYKHFKALHPNEWKRDKVEKNRNPDMFKSRQVN